MEALHRFEPARSADLGRPSRRRPKLGLAACFALAAACLLCLGCHGLNWLVPAEPEPAQTMPEFVGQPKPQLGSMHPKQQ